MSGIYDKGAWWPVALSAEVPGDAPRAVVVQGDELVLFRDRNGRIHALTDRCAHRRAPLSQGRITQDGLVECPYHGWRYDGASGACKAIPNLSAKEAIPKTYRVRSYAIAEVSGLVLVNTSQEPADMPEIPAEIAQADRETSVPVAFPYEGFFNLLVDAPSTVLDLPGLSIVDNHRFGDPVIEGNRLHQSFAVQRRRGGKGKVVADFPFALDIIAQLGGRFAQVRFRTMQGEVLTEAIVAAAPTRPFLTRAMCRERFAAGEPVQHIDIRTALEAERIGAVLPYGSRKLAAPPSQDSQPVSLEKELLDD